MKRIFTLIILLIILSSCTQQETSDDTLTIGLLATLSGPAAIHGTHVVMGAETAVEQLNLQGANITLVVEDNKNDPKAALSAYRKIMIHKPDVIFTTMSGASAAIIPLAEQDNVPVVTSLTYADFREYPHVYQYFQTTQDLAQLATDFFKKREIRKVGLLAQNIEAGHALMDVAKEKFAQENIDIVGIEYYGSDSDHRTQILKLVNEAPDALYVFDLRPDQIVSQIKEQYDGPIVFTDTPVATKLFESVPSLDGVYAAAQLYMIPGETQYEVFGKLFPQEANAEAAFGYDVVHLIWKASQQGALPQSISNLGEFRKLAGVVNLSQSRKPTIQIKMVKIQDGKLVVGHS